MAQFAQPAVTLMPPAGHCLEQQRMRGEKWVNDWNQGMF